MVNFPPCFTKNYYCVFLFVFLHIKSLLKMGLLLKNEVALCSSKLCSFIVDVFSEEGKFSTAYFTGVITHISKGTDTYKGWKLTHEKLDFTKERLCSPGKHFVFLLE